MVESVGNPRYGLFDRDYFQSLKNRNALSEPLREFYRAHEALLRADSLGVAAGGSAGPRGVAAGTPVSAVGSTVGGATVAGASTLDQLAVRTRAQVLGNLLDQQEIVGLSRHLNLIAEVGEAISQARIEAQPAANSAGGAVIAGPGLPGAVAGNPVSLPGRLPPVQPGTLGAPAATGAPGGAGGPLPSAVTGASPAPPALPMTATAATGPGPVPPGNSAAGDPIWPARLDALVQTVRAAVARATAGGDALAAGLDVAGLGLDGLTPLASPSEVADRFDGITASLASRREQVQARMSSLEQRVNERRVALAAGLGVAGASPGDSGGMGGPAGVAAGAASAGDRVGAVGPASGSPAAGAADAAIAPAAVDPNLDRLKVTLSGLASRPPAELFAAFRPEGLRRENVLHLLA